MNASDVVVPDLMQQRAKLRGALVGEATACHHDEELADLFLDSQIGRGTGRHASGGEAGNEQDSEKGAHWRDSLK